MRCLDHAHEVLRDTRAGLRARQYYCGLCVLHSQARDFHVSAGIRQVLKIWSADLTHFFVDSMQLSI